MSDIVPKLVWYVIFLLTGILNCIRYAGPAVCAVVPVAWYTINGTVISRLSVTRFFWGRLRIELY